VSKVHDVCEVFGRVTDDETRARKHLMFIMRLIYCTSTERGSTDRDAIFNEWSAHFDDDRTVASAYALLSADEQAELRRSVEEPAVKFFDNGKQLFIDAHLDLLARLEADVEVGSVTEKQLKRPAGTKAF
jgi:hypothetical protein